MLLECVDAGQPDCEPRLTTSESVQRVTAGVHRARTQRARTNREPRGAGRPRSRLERDSGKNGINSSAVLGALRMLTGQAAGHQFPRQPDRGRRNVVKTRLELARRASTTQARLSQLSQQIIPKGRKRCIHEEAHSLCISLHLRPCRGSAWPTSEYTPYEKATEAPGKEIEVITVNYAPGAADAVHRHDAHAVVYVLEGEVEMQVRGGTLQRLGPGQVFYESLEDVHTVSRNASKTKPAKFVVFFVKTEGAPILTPVH